MSASTDPAFEPVTDRAMLLRLAQSIGSDYPRSASIHNCLLLQGRGYIDSYVFYLLKEKPDTNVILVKAKNGQTLLALYCPEDLEDILLEALSRTKVIVWEEMLCFFYVPRTLVTDLKELVQGKIGDAKLESSEADFYSYQQGFCTRPTPGLSVKKMNTEAIGKMFSSWRYRGSTEVNEFLELCKKVPCAAVYRVSQDSSSGTCDPTALPDAEEHEEAVGWATATMYGTLGLIGVDQSLKGDTVKDKELRVCVEEMVVNTCEEAMRTEGYIAHCYQEEDENEVRRMIGWKRVDTFTWLWCCGKTEPQGAKEADKGTAEE